MATDNIASTSATTSTAASNPGNSFNDVVKQKYNDTSASEFAKSLTQASSSDDYDASQLVANAKAWAKANSLSDDYVTKTLTDYGSYSDEQKQSVLNDPTAWLNGLVSAYTPAETTESEAKQEVTTTPSTGQDNFYAGTNTKDHSDSLKQDYESSLTSASTAMDQATENAVKAAEAYQAQGSKANQELATAAKRQYDETIATREAIEANNGNRDGIGHEQYGSLEQAYNARLGEISTLEEQLKTQTIRNVADARAKGEYEKANAELATAQAKLKALYTEQMRIDKNLRSNYEWQTELDQEDKSIQAKQDATELEWQRSIGQSLLQAGIVPDDTILQSMGLSKEMAEKIAKYLKYGAGGSGGGGGSGSSGGGNTGGTKSTVTEESGDMSVYNAIDKLAASGQTVAAKAAIKQSSLSTSQKSELNSKANTYANYYANPIKNASSVGMSGGDAVNTAWYKKYYGTG